MDFALGHVDWCGPWGMVVLSGILVGLIGHVWRLRKKLREECDRNKRRESILTARESLLQKVLEYAPEDALVLTKDGKCVEVLSAVSGVFSSTKHSLKTQSIFDFIEKQTAEKILEKIEETLRTGEVIKFEYELEVEGRRRYFQAQARPFPYMEVEGETVLLVANDTTYHREQENALAESKRNLELALEGVSAGIWVFDVTTWQVFRSGKWARCLGYDFDEMSPDPTVFTSYIHPEDYITVQNAWNEHMEGRLSGFKVEHRMRCADGQYRWVLTWGRVVERWEDGRPKLVAGIHMDIDKSKRVSAALEESELRYRLLIENIPQVTWLADMEGKAFFISNNVERILGFDRDRILREGLALWEQRIHPEDYERTMASYKLLIEEKQEYDISYRFLRADGVYIWLRDQIRITCDSTGTQRIMGIFVDITQSVKDGERLKTALQEAQRLNHARSLFMASVSHELRNSLHAITGLADLLMVERDAQKYPIHLTQLKYQAESLNYFTTDILEYSSLETGNFKPAYSNFNLLELLDGLAELTRYKCAEKGLFFNYQLPLRFPKQYIYSDRFRMRQSLFNLLHNAVKFTHSGTVKFIVDIETVDAETNDYWIAVTVSDTGIGIPKELHEAIFQPYFTQGTQHGAGLGLAIVKGMVTALKGTITVDSEVGEGSSFTIRLPIRFEAHGGEQQVAISGASDWHSPENVQDMPSRPLRILVIDDEPVNRHLTVSWLEMRNFECEQESNGEMALARVLSRKFDAVLCDLHLPGMSGISLVKAIRTQIPKTGQMPIFALSADTTEEMRSAALDAGFDAVFAKPMALSALEMLLARLPVRPDAGSQFSPYVEGISPEMQSELVHMFQSELPEYYNRINNLAGQKNWHGVLEQLHKIKGALTVIGLSDLRQHGENLEQVIRMNQFSDELRNQACEAYLGNLNEYIGIGEIKTHG